MLEIPNNCLHLSLPWVLQRFTNLPNLTTHLMVSSLKKANENN